MSEIAFTCSLVDPFDFSALHDWIRRACDEGRLPATGETTIRINHPDREGEGSCRWCGAGRDETLKIVDGRLA